MALFVNIEEVKRLKVKNKDELIKRINETKKEIAVQLYYICSWGSWNKINKLKEELSLLEKQF